MRILGDLQVNLICYQISEMVIWWTARIFGKDHLYLLDKAQFTTQGKNFVTQTAEIAINRW
jgi:hypothetical protein